MQLILAMTDHAHVSPWVTALFAALLVGLILCLAMEEKLHAKKSVIAGLFAVVCLLLGASLDLLPFDDIVVGSQVIDGSAGGDELHEGGHEITMPVYIPAIDWSVIAIIFGSSLFVDVTSRSGLFTWIAVKVTKASGGDPLKLLISYGVMTVVFSAVLNNVTAMIIVGSLTVVSLEKLRQRERLLGFLLIEGLLTNIGGLLTLVSSVPNIIIGTAAEISFVTFFLKASPFVVVATVVTIWMGAKLFGVRRLANDQQRDEAALLVAGFDENDGIESRAFFWFSAVMTVLFIATIAAASALPAINDLGMGFVALAFATIMLVRYRSVADKFYQAIDWDLLGFFAALFVVINVMEHAQVLAAIGGVLEVVIGWNEIGPQDKLGTAAILIGSAGFSSVTDNIPLAAMLANILLDLNTVPDSPLWWSVVFGANLGGNLTPIGSASTLVAVTIMHKHKLPMSFAAFVKAALPYAAVQLVLATLYVLLVLPLY
jgi:Na+/H+ antiporter NhaD/arsenite permease-like protein